MSHIKNYNDFLSINEKAVIRKRGQEYRIEKVQGPHGIVNLYYNDSEILGAQDNHIYWEDLVNLHDSLTKL